MGQIRTATRYSVRKRAFLASLALDLISFGGWAGVRCRGSGIRFAARLPKLSKRAAIVQPRAVRNRRLVLESKFIRRMEKRGIGGLFLGGGDICVEQIQPVIHVCRTRSDNDLFHYCRLLQSFPTANSVGRQLRVLVFDEGQDRPALMGAIGLASGLYSLACRDRFLGWDLKGNRRLRNLTGWSFCTRASERVYITAKPCETELDGTREL